MAWKVDGAQAVDGELKERVLAKVGDRTVSTDDLLDYLTVFIQTANASEDVQEEVEGFDKRFLFAIGDGEDIWFTIKDQVLEMGTGDPGPIDITIAMDNQLMVEVLPGIKDITAQYMGGNIKIDGNINDAVKFRTILEIVHEELE